MQNSLGIDRITPSGLVEYEKCPLCFYYKVWLKLQIPTEKIHMHFGTAIHAALDWIYDKRADWNDEYILEGAIEILKSKFTIKHVDTIGLTKTERFNKLNEMLVDGTEMLKQFWEQKEILWAAGVQPVRMELPVKMTLWNPDTKEPLEIPISCRLDGECENSDVAEFKTSKDKYDIFETMASHQPRSYAWVQYCRTGKIPSLHYVILLKKRKRDKIQHLHIEYTEADILAYDSIVRSILEKIRNREFKRPVMGHQPYCDCYKYEALLKKQNL